MITIETIYPIAPLKTVFFIKRTIDIIAGLIGILFLALVFPIIALAIKIDSNGSIFYKQTRIGKNRRNQERRGNGHGKILVINNLRKEKSDRRQNNQCGSVFTIYKFRTMKVDAEVNGPQLCTDGVNDPRVTRVGSWLRFLHIDELPQFWSILSGKMSLVGPRPERPFFAEKYLQEIPYYLERMRYIKPGLTGLAQITLGYDTTIKSVTHKYYYDLTYRIAMSSFTSWLRMESWIIINTIRYLFNQLILTNYFKNLFAWKKFQIRKQEDHLFSNSTSINIAHPYKLIGKLNQRHRKYAGKLPSFIQDIKNSKEISFS